MPSDALQAVLLGAYLQDAAFRSSVDSGAFSEPFRGILEGLQASPVDTRPLEKWLASHGCQWVSEKGGPKAIDGVCDSVAGQQRLETAARVRHKAKHILASTPEQVATKLSSLIDELKPVIEEPNE